jgi:3-deoxy-D-manno-octulosonate 8-phosphate phosphatase (KDO 8-P phosphatase)
MNLLESFSRIKAFVFDMDGVLTDGTLLVMPGGEWIRQMHIHDGYALQLAVKQGYRVCVISGSSSDPVQERLERLGVRDIFMKVSDKAAVLSSYMKEHGLSREQVLYMGDDVPDVAVSRLAGLPCCPADAMPDMREVAQYISLTPGGYGCVREVIEKVLRIHEKWDAGGTLRSL